MEVYKVKPQNVVHVK